LHVLSQKLKEVLYSVLPITLIVLLLNFLIIPLETSLLIRFLLGSLLIILGLAIFLFGVDICITPLGQLMGSALAKTNKIWIIGIGGLLLGFFICIAEPDLHVLAGQVEFVTSGLLSKLRIVVVVSIGIAVMIALGLIRIVYNLSLRTFFAIVYGLIFLLALFTSSEFLAISFDAAGAATGALTVPFILALAAGVAALKKDSLASEKDSFGLVNIAACGVIISVMLMGIFSKTDEITASLDYSIAQSSSIIAPFLQNLVKVIPEILLALLPLFIMFLIFQKISFKMPRKNVNKIFKGFLYAFIGLILFLTGVNAGFMDLGSTIGYELASLDNKFYILIIGFILGLVTILAEPSVYVLTHQIEDVTSGYVRRKFVLTALSLGVGCAVALSILKIIIPGLQLWHFLLPGYLISLLLMYIVPDLFVGMAFDSGSVASGPMAATFILAFAQGAAAGTEGANVLIDGFGVIAMVSLTPLIALQILGLMYKIKSRKGGVTADGKDS